MIAKLTRIASAVLPVWLGAFLIFPVFPTALPRDANVAREAWWSFYGQGLPVAPPTTVPADALAVGHNLAQPDKVAAIGITLQAPAGATIQTLKLVLKEAEGAGANLGTAVVVACPITGPWEPVVNGNWADAPDYDCELGKEPGKRSDDGLWTFDLSPIGSQWLDAEFPLEQAGVLFLIEQATEPVQISFRGIKTGEFRLEFAASAPAETEPVGPLVVGGLEVPETPAAAPAPAQPTTNDATPAVLLTQPAQNRSGNPTEPDLLGNLPWGAWLLVPIALGIAGVVSYALGAGAHRGGRANRRAGAVSRALSRGQQEG